MENAKIILSLRLQQWKEKLKSVYPLEIYSRVKENMIKHNSSCIWRAILRPKLRSFIALQRTNPNKPSVSAQAALGAHHSSSLFTVTIHDRNRERERCEGI